MIYPDFPTFEKLSSQGNLIPVYREILADLDTPLSAFAKIGGKQSFLFESLEGGEKWARYSFLGSNPSMTLALRGREVILTRGKRQETVQFASDPFEVVEKEFSHCEPISVPGLPRFYGGFVGYIGYDTVRFFENIGEKWHKSPAPDDLFLMLADTVLIFDNLKHVIKIVCNASVEDGTPETAYKEAVEKIDQIVSQMRSAPCMPEQESRLNSKEVTSNFTKSEFMEAVKKAKHYIQQGDVIQTVLSQCFEKDVEVHPIHVYRALRQINPSPYMFYLNTGEVTLVGSSPEILVRLENGRIEVRPIAGTRRRGKSREEDLALEQELLADPKENAEHIMLVDLGRNDAGRVAIIGSVNVRELKTVERYSHVMHITSSVEGQLAPGYNMFDLLRATFPAGTLTGAPKIRAMEIIEELEPVRRGTYGGAVGYFGFSGNMDMCITIRTILFHGKKAYIQAGAGIVADSDPESEYDETVNKAKGMVKAIEMAEKGLD
jgi:anthranilate synthase component 1